MLARHPASSSAGGDDAASCFDERARYALNTHAAMRVSRHGIRFYDEPVSHGGDRRARCVGVADAMCAAFEINVTFFSCAPPPATRAVAPPPSAASTAAGLLLRDLWQLEQPCGKIVGARGRWHLDVTMCDLAAPSQPSILYSPHDETLSVALDLDLSTGVKVAVGVSMLWLVVSLGESMVAVLENRPHAVAPGLAYKLASLAAAVVILLCILLSTGPDGRVADIFPTATERGVYYATAAYVGLYCLYHLYFPNTVNIVVGCMALVTSRMYMTAETPYAPVFVFMVISRAVQKIARSDLYAGFVLEWASRLVMVIVDVCFAATLLACGFVSSCSSPFVGWMQAMGLAHAAILFGVFLCPSVGGIAASAGGATEKTKVV